jgi:hypothetical protein
MEINQPKSIKPKMMSMNYEVVYWVRRIKAKGMQQIGIKQGLGIYYLA